MNEVLAPVILFVYNRPEHTKRTISALQKNILANETDLFIFCDAAKTSKDEEKVEEVKSIINNTTGFNKLSIKIANDNKGLANSVISGVSEIIDTYGKVIVLEDDLITSRFFLKYMNEVLDIYKDDSNIWSVSGYTPGIKIPDEYEDNMYIVRRGCSWGWGTWKNRWNSVDWNIKSYNTFIRNRKKIKEFNQGGNDLTYMLQDQFHRRIDSWAIRWVYNQYQNKQYTIYPVNSLVQNIGTDSSGTHSSSTKKYEVELYEDLMYVAPNLEFNEKINRSFKEFYNLNLFGYIGVLSRRIGMYRLLKKIRKIINV
ncbi:sugar transferase [Priestia aryabhattai]